MSARIPVTTSRPVASATTPQKASASSNLSRSVNVSSPAAGMSKSIMSATISSSSNSNVMSPSSNRPGTPSSTARGVANSGLPPTTPKSTNTPPPTHRDPMDKSMMSTHNASMMSTHNAGPSSGGENIKVYVRLRDYNQKEKDNWIPNDLAVRMSNATTEVTIPGRGKFPFTFDECFWSNSMEEEGKPYADQCDLFDVVGAPLVANVMAGFNSSIIAYGQTGSGKTYSIFGPSVDEEGTKKGLIPRVCDGIFSRLANEGQSSSKITVSITMLEIYLEDVFDLLSTRKKLTVRQETSTSFGVVGAKSVEVKNYNDVLKLIEKGDSLKTFAATAVNDRSSRAHTLFQLVVTTVTPTGTRSAKVMLADLAGSERVKVSKTDTGTALDEACNINLSLLTLGTCIEAAVQRSKQGKSIENMGEFRQSTLTKLLKDFIGGNSRTAILVAIAPALKDVMLTLQALRFADRAKQITTHAKMNYVSAKNAKVADEALKQMFESKRELLEKEFQLECAQNDLKSKQDEIAMTRVQLDEERAMIQARVKSNETSEEEKKMLQARVNEIESTMKGLSQELIDMEKERETMREKLLEICQDNAAIVSDKEVLERKVNELQMTLADLENEKSEELQMAEDKINTLNSEIETMEERLKAREAYHTRIAAETKLANEKAFTDMKVSLEKELATSRSDSAAKIEELEKQLEASRKQCFSLTASLETTSAAFEQHRNDTIVAMAGKDETHKKTLDAMNSDFSAKIAALEQSLAGAQKDHNNELEAKIAVQKELADLTATHKQVSEDQNATIGGLESSLAKAIASHEAAATSACDKLSVMTREKITTVEVVTRSRDSTISFIDGVVSHVCAMYESKEAELLAAFATIQRAANADAQRHVASLESAQKEAVAVLDAAVADLKSSVTEKKAVIAARDAEIVLYKSTIATLEESVSDWTAKNAAAEKNLAEKTSEYEQSLQKSNDDHAAATESQAASHKVTFEGLKREIADAEGRIIAAMEAAKAQNEETKAQMAALTAAHESATMDMELRNEEAIAQMQSALDTLTIELANEKQHATDLIASVTAEKAAVAERDGEIVQLNKVVAEREAEMIAMTNHHEEQSRQQEASAQKKLSDANAAHHSEIESLKSRAAMIGHQRQGHANALAQEAQAAQALLQQALAKFHSAMADVPTSLDAPALEDTATNYGDASASNPSLVSSSTGENETSVNVRNKSISPSHLSERNANTIA